MQDMELPASATAGWGRNMDCAFVFFGFRSPSDPWKQSFEGILVHPGDR